MTEPSEAEIRAAGKAWYQDSQAQLEGVTEEKPDQDTVERLVGKLRSKSADYADARKAADLLTAMNRVVQAADAFTNRGSLSKAPYQYEDGYVQRLHDSLDALDALLATLDQGGSDG